MRRLVLIAVVAASVGCSDDAFQLGSGQPDTDPVITEVSTDAESDTSEPDAEEEDSSSVDGSEPDTTVTVDSGTDSSDLRDSGKPDTGTFDTSVVLDTGPFDTGPFDTGTFDSGFDTGKPDTGPFDTGTFDTGPFDTGTFDSGFDTGRVDSGFDSGTFDSGSDTTTGDGGMCPMPPTTAMPASYSGAACDKLISTYAEQLQASRPCGCDADCNKEVPRDFCGCTVYVNPGNPAYPNLAAIRTEFMNKGCFTACPFTACVVAPARCVAGDGGARFCADGPVLSGG